MVHVDNCPVYTSQASTSWLEEQGMFCMPHPSYSPDLAPSDFYLLPTVKEKLERIPLPDDDHFFECVPDILMDMNHDELNQVFRTWVERVQEVSPGIGDYPT
jgi:hypothetical protein